MAGINSILLLITGDATGALTSIDKTAAGMTELQGEADATGGSFAGMALKIGAAVATAVIAVAGFATVLATKYDNSLHAVAASTGQSMAQVNAIGDAFLSTGGKSVFTAQTILDAFALVSGQLKETEGHALDEAEAMQVMSAASDLASASHTSLGSATTVLANIMQQFRIPTAGAAAVANDLYVVSDATSLSVSSLGTSLVRASSQMGAASPPISTLSAIVLDLAQHNETGRTAVSALGSMFTGIISPTTAVTAAQQKLGLSFKDANGNLLPFQQILTQLQPVLANMSPTAAAAELKTLGFGAASVKLASTIQAGPAVFQKYLDQVNATGTAHTAATTATDTLSGGFNKLKSMVMDDATAWGEKLLPVLTTAEYWLATEIPLAIAAVEGWFNKNKATIQTVAKVVGTILVDAFKAAKVILGDVVDVLGFFGQHLDIIGPILLAVVAGFVAWKTAMMISNTIAMLQSMFSQLVVGLIGVQGAEEGATESMGTLDAIMDTNPFVLIIAGIVAVIAIGLLLITHWKQVVAIAKTVWKDVSGFFELMWHDVVGFVTHLWNDVTGWFAKMWSDIVGACTAGVSAVVGFFTGLWNDVTGVVKAILGWVAQNWPYILGLLGGPIGLAVAFIATHMTQVIGILKGIWTTVTTDIKNFVDGAVGFITGFPSRVLAGLANLYSKVGGFLSGVWSQITSDVGGFIGGIINWFTGLPSKLASAFGNLVGAIANAVKNATKSIPVIGGVLGAIGLATGGYVTQPTLALVGEKGPEYVIPESQMVSGYRAGVKALSAGSMAAAASGGGAAQAHVQIVVQGLVAADVVPAIDQRIGQWVGKSLQAVGAG